MSENYSQKPFDDFNQSRYVAASEVDFYQI